MLLCNHLMQNSVNDQTHEKFTFSPHFFSSFICSYSVNVTDVEIVVVVMLSDVFLLSFNYRKKPSSLLEWLQSLRSSREEFTFFLWHFLHVSVCQMAGVFSCCKANHNWVSESIFQHVPRKQRASVFWICVFCSLFCLCGTCDTQSIAAESEHSYSLSYQKEVKCYNCILPVSRWGEMVSSCGPC